MLKLKQVHSAKFGSGNIGTVFEFEDEITYMMTMRPGDSAQQVADNLRSMANRITEDLKGRAAHAEG